MSQKSEGRFFAGGWEEHNDGGIWDPFSHSLPSFLTKV